MANIVVSWLTPIKLRDFWMVGEKKSAKIDFMTQQLDIYDKGITPSYDSFGAFKLITREGGENRPFIQNREPLKEEITHFIDCIINDKKPIVGGQEACSIIKIIEACYKSIKEEKTVKINLK